MTPRPTVTRAGSMTRIMGAQIRVTTTQNSIGHKQCSLARPLNFVVDVNEGQRVVAVSRVTLRNSIAAAAAAATALGGWHE